jgi:hypothetical protein
MSIEELKNEVLAMLPESNISRHQKIMVSILLGTFDQSQLESVYSALKLESETMSQLARKEERINLKYEMAIDKVISSKG